MQKLVGQRIREHRELLGISQERLAERLGIHRTYVGIIERGERNLSFQTFERFAESLGVDRNDLLL